MRRRVQVKGYDKAEVAKCADEVARLPRHSPHLELITVAAHLVQVLPFVAAQLLLQIVTAVVVVDEEIVI